MTVQTHCIVETVATLAAETNVYTSPAGIRTIIDKMTGYATAAGTLTVKLVPSGGSAGTANVQASKTFALGDSYSWPEIVGQTLEPGDFISVLGTVAAAVNFRASGRTVA